MNAAREIEVLIRAKYPILYIVSWEERRVEESVQRVSQSLSRTLHTWTVTQGLRPPISRPGLNAPRAGGTLPGELEVLAQIHEAPEYTAFLLRDFHPYLKDYRVVRLLRDLALRLRGRTQTLILSGPVLTLPSDLEKDVTVIDFPLPTAEEIDETLTRVQAAVRENASITAEVPPDLRERLVKSAQGLTQDEIESTFARSLVEKRAFDVDVVLEEKKQIIRKSGLLEYYEPDSALKDVGGLEELKEWLGQRSQSFTDKARAFGIPAPKGILLLGVQGCGKSLTAKAVAALWNLPLLKLDVGRIFGSLVGQSEENIRKAIRVAESVAPCILWADELEKGFAGASGGVSDSGTTARVFGTFLTWMSEKKSAVFMIATANDVTSLPPEMLRKGRFDEIFFVDLPDRAEREEIFRIHLAKRNRDPGQFDLVKLADVTDGFSGAEIEQVVVGALHLAFFADRELGQEDLVAESDAVVPLSEMMREDISELRDWAKLRTRPASRRDG
ncbi:MAG: AAA family ATPase [Fimbriimonadaceae bacterium]|nr:AAA family ATPase [Fimbriimonadaceae bacterium]